MTQTARELRIALESVLSSFVADPCAARNPGHRIPFKWPPHAVSHDYHVLPHDWKSAGKINIHGEEFDLYEAVTPSGVFGRIEDLFLDAMGESERAMIHNIKRRATPFLTRMETIGMTLGLPDRFRGKLRDLAPIDLLKLLYCSDRDVAHEARILIETHASAGVFGESLIVILQDRSHPNRRVAQWCVLDMFEDLPSFCRSEDEQKLAVTAIRDLIWDSEDDYARVIYKAGVVLGGHICTSFAADGLLQCLHAPSKIGRRSAIHGVFHLVEWMPECRATVVENLRLVAERDSEPILKTFAAHMARDIGRSETDHVTEPIFPEELGT